MSLGQSYSTHEGKRFYFKEMLQALEKAKVDMPKKIAEAGQKYFMLNFRKKQTPDGIKWEPKKIPNGKPTGVASGNLRSKMDNTILTYDYKRIVWEIKGVPYAAYFQDGTDRMVARPIIEDGKEIRGKIKGVIKSEFNTIMLRK